MKYHLLCFNFVKQCINDSGKQEELRVRFFYGVVGAGWIWWEAPVEYDDPPPPFIRNCFGWPPLYPKIIDMTLPPPNKEKKRKKNEKIKFKLSFKWP